MPRPKNNRIVFEPPLYKVFVPKGEDSVKPGKVKIGLDEIEAVRLADYNGLTHEEASVAMQISRSTFTRLIEKARKKIADIVINGKELVIEGGNVHFKNNVIKCLDCHVVVKTKIEECITECPTCHSHNLLNFAGSYGHGDCCTNI
ncbi:MAG: DUF134 domain-containing protein [Chlorobi bacterium]|nr:DUF134 domain-containing protein [Chlorobiota bacterium]